MRLLLTGSRGMLGSSIAERWRVQRPNDELVTLTRADVDLRDPETTRSAIDRLRPDAVIHAAAVVGGIAAKLAHPTRFLRENLLIDSSVIGAAMDAGVPELINIGSAAVYPETLRQPFMESDLLAAPLEKANEGYAVAKIAGMKMCEYASEEFGVSYHTVIPSNLYGPNDDHSLEQGHLIAAAIAKVSVAKAAGHPAVTVWGDGTARREFTYSIDLASWLVDQVGLTGRWPAWINLGVGVDHSIREYYEAAAKVVGYLGPLDYDTTKPTGMHERILDSSVARNLGWAPATSLADGMAAVYRSYRNTQHGAPNERNA